MSPLFGNREEKAAQRDAGNAEVERISAMPAVELAAEIMPAFGPNGIKGRGKDHEINQLQIIMRLLQDVRGADKAATRLQQPVREAVQALENAGLVVQTPGHDASWYCATKLGLSSLADGTVSQHLPSS